MNRIYHYHVNIRFRGNGPATRIGRRYSEYAGSQGFRDTFVFFPKSCSMVLSRTRSYVDGEILSKANNSINTQIIKALLCYYAVSGDFPIVDRRNLQVSWQESPYMETIQGIDVWSG